MDLETGLEQFKQAMLEKFRAREEKQGARSVTRVGTRLLDQEDIYSWLHERFSSKEFGTAVSFEAEAKEAVDVANMAFLIWLHNTTFPITLTPTLERALGTRYNVKREVARGEG